MVVPEITFVVGSLYKRTGGKKLVDRGGEIKIITDFSYRHIELVHRT